MGFMVDSGANVRLKSELMAMSRKARLGMVSFAIAEAGVGTSVCFMTGRDALSRSEAQRLMPVRNRLHHGRGMEGFVRGSPSVTS